jgi:hypothetical protein
MSHVESDRLDLWALGVLTPVEAKEIDAHLVGCRSCAGAAAKANEAIAFVALSLAPVTPRPQVRARLLAGAEGKGRLAQWASQLAKFFDLGVEKARGLLDAVDEPAAWEDDTVPGLLLMHFQGGPALAGADCGLIRFPAGIEWPLHKHLGDEQMFVLEGGFVEDGGAEYRAGAILKKAAGTQHSFTIMPDRDCVCAVSLIEGIEMPIGNPIRMKG